MKPYLQGNLNYWHKGYETEHVESFVFRPYAHIFVADLGIDGSRHEKLLDFGCGCGTALKFFKDKGFDVYGVDISETNIQCCKRRMPDIADHFSLVESNPDQRRVHFDGSFDVVLGIQSLYYLSATDLQACLAALYKQMNQGGIIYATMMGTKCWYYDHSVEYQDGLRRVDVSVARFTVKDYYVNFTENEEDLRRKFALFEPLHIGFYAAQYRADEGPGFHYTFVGRKA